MSETNYEIIGNHFVDTSDVPRGDDIFYRCLKCGAVVSSIPEESTRCLCRNIIIDVDFMRLVVDKMNKLEVVRSVA